MTTQNPEREIQSQLAEARAGTYRLLSRIYAKELDREVLEFLRENSGFISSQFPSGEEEEKWLQTLRVEYSHLFLMNVYPYESLYTGQEVMLNTAETEQVQAFYEELGFNNSREVFADHIAIELEFMATLAQQESRFWQENLTTQAAYLAEVARTFLSEHLLNWLSVFSLAVQRNSHQSFYRELAQETLNFVCQDFAQLSKSLRKKAKQFASSIPDPESVNERSLSNLVRYLITPSECGFYLSKAELLRLAQIMQLPAGGADRFQMLKNLFESAAQYEMLETLLERLQEIGEYYQSEFTRLGEEFEEISPLWQGWQNRLSATEQLLEEARLSAIAMSKQDRNTE